MPRTANGTAATFFAKRNPKIDTAPTVADDFHLECTEGRKAGVSIEGSAFGALPPTWPEGNRTILVSEQATFCLFAEGLKSCYSASLKRQVSRVFPFAS